MVFLFWFCLSPSSPRPVALSRSFHGIPSSLIILSMLLAVYWSVEEYDMLDVAGHVSMASCSHAAVSQLIKREVSLPVSN